MRKLYSLLALMFVLSGLRAQQDCQTPTPVCGSGNIAITPVGPGTVNEPLGGCLSTEHNSVWFEITIARSGTLTMTITPNTPTDYDFGIYGPNVTCATRGTPARGSYAAGAGPTGLNMTDTDICEDAGGDRWAKYMDVVAGEKYLLVVDNFQTNNVTGFTLVWGGTAEISSPLNNPALTPNPITQPGINHDGNVYLCSTPSTFDFQSLSPQILNGNQNVVIGYYRTAANAAAQTNPITSPISVSANQTYYYVVRYNNPADPTDPNNSCLLVKEFTFKDGSIPVSPKTVYACNNYTATVGTFNLTEANLYPGSTTVTVKYYPTQTDAANGTNEILPSQAAAYTSAAGTVYAKYFNQYQCTNIAPITLAFYPKLNVPITDQVGCFVPENPSNGTFNLTNAISVTPAVLSTLEIKFYTTLNDALNDVNPITNNLTQYVSPSTTIYVRYKLKDPNAPQCWDVKPLNLKVTPPAYSSTLVDQAICLEQKTTLDAGRGYTSYRWSTGATTQLITNVGVGEYWVDLVKDGCTTRQKVRVAAYANPVITQMETSGNKVTVTVKGGKPPYQYSTDKATWQTGNVLSNVKRGEVTVYVKDANGCEPVSATVTVPNFINAITPNGDGINDALDFSALQYKANLRLAVYDRQGNKIFEGKPDNSFSWDGRVGNKKVATGTYWYVISWQETNGMMNNHTDWIMVKNQ